MGIRYKIQKSIEKGGIFYLLHRWKFVWSFFLLSMRCVCETMKIDYFALFCAYFTFRSAKWFSRSNRNKPISKWLNMSFPYYVHVHGPTIKPISLNFSTHNKFQHNTHTSLYINVNKCSFSQFERIWIHMMSKHTKPMPTCLLMRNSDDFS